jgi:hypothetical protein
MTDYGSKPVENCEKRWSFPAVYAAVSDGRNERPGIVPVSKEKWRNSLFEAIMAVHVIKESFRIVQVA